MASSTQSELTGIALALEESLPGEDLSATSYHHSDGLTRVNVHTVVCVEPTSCSCFIATHVVTLRTRVVNLLNLLQPEFIAGVVTRFIKVKAY